MEYPTTSLVPPMQPMQPAQPVLADFDVPDPTAPVSTSVVASAGALEADVRVRPAVESTAAEHTERRTPRHRYWSMRDLSRRIWVGRGYELLRGLIRAGILPATRSARSWWVADADVEGLLAAFEDRAGKVRAFRGLEEWLRERCYVAPLTAENAAALRNERLGFAWRSNVYLPKTAWRVDFGPDGRVTYFHQSGATIPPVREPVREEVAA